jgi:quercetin dioxygenase-like cupin family protein
MLRKGGLRWTLVMAIVVLAALDGAPTTATQAPGLERTILQRQDLAGVPGYEVLLVEAMIPVGGREGRHTHAGTMIGYLTQGTFTLDIEGTFTDLLPGGSAIVGPGKVHEGINRGKTPIKALVTFIVEKGKPLSTPVQ